MRFGLIANLRRLGAAAAVIQCVEWAKSSEQPLILAEELQPVATDHSDFCSDEKIASEVDLLISMGGDGTLLATARKVGPTGTPILGINIGSLGFLTQQTPEQLEPALDAIVDGNYHIEERMLLKATLEGREIEPSCYALNDIVLSFGSISRLIDITLSVNGETAVTYKADGLIIATPTGSTAYNLAVGGPIVHPSIEAMIAAPISPFSLTTRPMLFNPTDQLELQVVTEEREANLTLDGQVMVKLADGEKVTVSAADFRARFVTFEGNSFYSLLKTKLNWGVPPNFNV